MSIKRPFKPKWNLNLPVPAPTKRGWKVPGMSLKPTSRTGGRVHLGAYDNRYPDPAPGAFPGVLGMNTHTFFDIDTWWPYMAQNGIYWARINLSWDRFEPTTQGVYDWSYFDSVFTLAANTKMNLLGILDGIPTWTSMLDQAAYAAAYGNAATLAVQRYGTGGTFWAAHPELTPLPLAAIELMNEPYYATRWANNVAGYTVTVRAGLTAIKAADPAIKVGVPVEYGSYWMPGIMSNDPTVLRDCDFLSMHPYLSFSGGVNGPRDVSQLVQKSFWRIGPIRDWTPNTYPKKPVWITEFGFTNASGVTAYVDEATSATWLKDALDLSFRHFTFVEKFFYYDMSISTGNMTQQEGNFGVIKPDGVTLKPVWYEFIKYGG